MSRKPRTLRDIENHPMVESTHTEWDGCFTDASGREVKGRWVYLKPGFICEAMECGTIHEATIRECCEMLDCSRAITSAERAAGINCDPEPFIGPPENIGTRAPKPSDAAANGESPFLAALRGTDHV